MKKFALWLARITGVEDELRNKHAREIGGRINSAHYWFNGGFDGKPKIEVLNTLFLIGESLKKYAWFDIDNIRKKVYKLGETPYHTLSKEEIQELTY